MNQSLALVVFGLVVGGAAAWAIAPKPLQDAIRADARHLLGMDERRSSGRVRIARGRRTVRPKAPRRARKALAA
jgi:hypothetical protein